MNFSTAIFLVRSDIRAVAVSYDVDSEGKGIRPFVMHKTADQTMGVGDYVVIPTDTRHGLTVARVEEVDLEVDFDNMTPAKWIVGALDLGAYENLLAKETEVIDAIKSAEKRRKREELADKLRADTPEVAQFTDLALPSPAA